MSFPEDVICDSVKFFRDDAGQMIDGLFERIKEMYPYEPLIRIIRTAIRYNNPIIEKIFNKIDVLEYSNMYRRHLLLPIMEELSTHQNIEIIEIVTSMIGKCNTYNRLMALHYAAVMFQLPIITNKFDPLEIAIVQKNIDVVGELIKRPCSIAKVNQYNNNALHTAAGCLGADVEILRMIIASNLFDINAKNNGGLTPLGEAIMCDNKKCALELVRSGCDVDVEMQAGKYPIHHAAMSCCNDLLAVEFFDVLIGRKETDIDRTVIYWYGNIGIVNTPLSFAVEYQNSLFVKKLIESGCKMTKSTSSLLYCAINMNNQQIIDQLLECNSPDPTEKSRYFKWELNKLSRCCNYWSDPIKSVVKILIEKLISLNDIDDIDLLHIAQRAGLNDVAIKLIDLGIDINLGDSLKSTPLYLATGNENDQLFNKLISRPNINVNAQTVCGNNALLAAADIGRVDYFERLIKAGADPFVQNYYGENVLHFAASNGHIDIIMSFKKHVYQKNISEVMI